MTAFKLGVLSSLILAGMIALEKWHLSHQEKIIVYNVPTHKAIDFVDGNRYQFVGDDDLGWPVAEFSFKTRAYFFNA